MRPADHHSWGSAPWFVRPSMSLPAFSPARLPSLSGLAAQLAARWPSLPAGSPGLDPVPPVLPEFACNPSLPSPLPGRPPVLAARFLSLALLVAANCLLLLASFPGLDPVLPVLPEFACNPSLPSPLPGRPPVLAARFLSLAPPALRQAARSPPWPR